MLGAFSDAELKEFAIKIIMRQMMYKSSVSVFRTEKGRFYI